MNNILIIDDREDFVEGFINIASSKGIVVAKEKSFEGLKNKMPKLQHKIAVVILDIKCLISDNQEIESEDFIGTAITYLDQNYPNFPRMILTGDDDAFKGYQTYHKDEEIFLKTDDEIEKLFDRVKYYCDNSENLRIKREYPEIFEIFEQGLINYREEQLLINILKNIDENDQTKFGGILRDIRSIQEIIYKQINEKDKNVVPDSMFKLNDDMIDFNKLMRHLSGNKDRNNNYQTTSRIYQNQAIENFSNTLYRTSGEYLHGGINREYMISNMALKSLIYNLLELLLWSKQYLK